MTKEEAEIYAKTMTFRDAIYNLEQARCIPYRKATFIKINELINLIEASEQEPCEDAISRSRLKECFHRNVVNGEAFDDLIDAQPSVRPQKRGSWIERFNEEERWLMCTECRQDSDKAYNFCPNCGAKMEG